MKAWPFLISANPFLENQPVVVPDFIKEAGAVREIVRAAGGFSTEPGEAIYYRGYREGVGVIDMVFRVIRDGTTRLLGLDEDAPLLDQTKTRRVGVIEGFVLREDALGKTFTKEQLDAAHSLVEEPFRRYWNEERQWEPVISRSFDLEQAQGEALRLTVKESPTLPPDRPTSSTTSNIGGDNASTIDRKQQGGEKKTVTPGPKSSESSATTTPKVSPKDEPPPKNDPPKDNPPIEYTIGGIMITFGILCIVFAQENIVGALLKFAGIASIVFGTITVIRGVIKVLTRRFK